MKKLKELRFIYTAKIVTDLVILLYLLIAAYRPIFDGSFFNMLFWLSLLFSAMLFARYWKQPSFPVANYLIYSLITIYMYLKLMGDVSDSYGLHALILGFLAPLNSYRMFKTMTANVMIYHEQR